MRVIFFLVSVIIIKVSSGQISYPDNETGSFEDMLTPQYYESDNAVFRKEVNEFIYFARLLPFQHPLKDSLVINPTFTVGKGFGNEMGRLEPVQHHPAIDYHPENNVTEVSIFASHDGFVRIYRDAAKYRHYLSVATDIENDSGIVLGKISTIYGHVDLDLDSLEGINFRNKYVTKGEVISKHLYEGTVGGPHLHFEIRYYRPGDKGTEDFYGIPAMNSNYTIASGGSWQYGSWDPEIGFGFANSENHLNNSTVNAFDINNSDIKCYPNPTTNHITIEFQNQSGPVLPVLVNMQGRKLKINSIINFNNISCDLSSCVPGQYILNICNKKQKFSTIIFKQ